MSAFVTEGVGRKDEKQVRGEPLELKGGRDPHLLQPDSSTQEIGWGAPGLQAPISSSLQCL